MKYVNKINLYKAFVQSFNKSDNIFHFQYFFKAKGAGFFRPDKTENMGFRIALWISYVYVYIFMKKIQPFLIMFKAYHDLELNITPPLTDWLCAMVHLLAVECILVSS